MLGGLIYMNNEQVISYKNSELTKFAKDCSWGLNQMLNGICMAEDITRTDIAKDFLNGCEYENKLLLEVSKRFSKYAEDYISFDCEIGEVQDFHFIIDKIIECCEENNWFQEYK
jgi:hypothetical protein